MKKKRKTWALFLFRFSCGWEKRSRWCERSVGYSATRELAHCEVLLHTCLFRSFLSKVKIPDISVAFPHTQPSLGNVPDSVVVCVRAKIKRNHTTLAKELKEIKSWPDLSWQTWRLKLQSDIHVCTRQHSWDSDPIPVDPTPSSAGCVPLHVPPTDGHFDGVSTKVD